MGQCHHANGVGWIVEGQGPAIVFLHGMPGSRDSWEPQIKALSGNYQTIAWDMPGYGASATQPDVATPAAMAQVLAKTMKADMSVERAHVIGLSLGGMIAMELALAHPEMVESLVLLDSAPKFGLDGTSVAEDFVASVSGPLKNGTPLTELCREILLDLIGNSFTGASFEDALASMSRASPEGLVHAAKLIGNHDALDRLKNISVNTLVMAGAQDQATPMAASEIIAREIPNSDLVEIPDAGHLSNLENSQFVNKQLKNFIASQCA